MKSDGIRANIRLIHKGIFLVSVPLFFELLFVGTLMYLNAGAEAEAARAAHSKQISDGINHIVKDLAAVMKQVDGRALLEPGYDVGAFRRRVSAINQQVSDLQILVQGDKRQSAIVAEARSIFDDVENMIEPVIKIYQTEGPAAVQIEMRSRRKPLQRRLTVLASSEFIDLAREHQEVEDRSPAIQADFRRKVTLVVRFFLGFNVLLTLFLASYFVKGISRRIAVLTDNTVRLAQGKPLQPEIGGSDEIAHLDKVFHGMATALAEAERSKQEMIGMVTHDLKTPLTTVSALLEMLEDGVYGQINEQGLASVKVVSRNLTRMNWLIRDLLDIEKIKSGMMQLERSNQTVKELLQEAADSVGALASDREIAIEINCEHTEVYADHQRVLQVLINLLSNAIKFSPTKSQIIIRAAHEGSFVRFSVQDHGRGIPADMRAAIFQRFQQTQSSDATVKGGSGLGLAICKALVELHGGQIGVDSREGQGSTFFFTIPASEAATALPVSPAKTEAGV